MQIHLCYPNAVADHHLYRCFSDEIVDCVGAGGGWGMGLGGGFCLRCRKSRGYEEQAGQGEPSCEGMERCHDVADSSIGVVAGW